MRYINISNEKDRDAKVVYKAISSPKDVHMGLESGEKTENRRVLKGTSKNTICALLETYKDLNGVAENIISGDPELDIELVGKKVGVTSRVYINSDEKIVYKVKKNEKVFLPDGTVKEEREPRHLLSNILDTSPVKWTGKLFPREKIYNKLIFGKNYQICHVNGLTYDFLFGMAKDLSDKDSMMMVQGADNPKGALIFNDGGKPYQGFLEGRVDGEKYCLILHLTDLQLKPLPEGK